MALCLRLHILMTFSGKRGNEDTDTQAKIVKPLIPFVHLPAPESENVFVDIFVFIKKNTIYVIVVIIITQAQAQATKHRAFDCHLSSSPFFAATVCDGCSIQRCVI